MHEFLSFHTNSTHPDLSPARIKRDQKDVQTALETILSMFINPFDDQMDLISLSTGVAPTEKVTEDLLNAESIGDMALRKFQQERLTDQKVDFFDPIKKLKLGTFAKLIKKTVKVMKSGQVAQFSAQSNIFGKIALIQQLRPLNLKEVFSYPLGPIPWALATSSGEMVKTSKSALMHHIEKGATHLQRVQKPFAAVIDGMALVRKVKPSGHTYDSYADEVLKAAILTSGEAARIDIVFDVYRKQSIKNAERGKRESGKLLVKRIIGKQPIKQFLAFLSNGENKMELIRFLASRWQANHSPSSTKQIYVAYDQSCLLLGGGAVQGLSCNQEEADTRMLFHAKDMMETYQTVFLHTPDTDVFVIALGMSGDLGDDIYMKTGTGNKTRIMNLNEIKKMLPSNFDTLDKNVLSKALLALHGFTGCDTISAFSGKGKVRPLQLMLKNQSFITFFASFGTQYNRRSVCCLPTIRVPAIWT